MTYTPESSPPPTLSQLRQFATERLPELNLAARDGNLGFARWVDAVKPNLAGVDKLASQVNDLGRHELMKIAGVFAHSVEALGQREGLQPGGAMQFLQGLDVAILLAAGETGPPLPAMSYWLDEPHFEFTAEQYPQQFRAAVREQVRLSNEVNTVLRRLIDRDIDIASSSGPHFLRFVASLIEENRQAYLRFYKESDIEAFQRFRFWLAPCVIFGKKWTGPNAAALEAMTSRDLLLGTADSEYSNYLHELRPYFTADEQRISAADERRGSIMRLIATRLGYADVDAFAAAPVADAAERVAGVEYLHASLVALHDAMRSQFYSACSHMALVKTRLSDRIDSSSVTTDAINASGGVSGRPHNHLEQLRVMRRDHPAVRQLAAVLSAVAELKGTA